MAKLILKRSSVAAKVPLATDLQPGELAVNLADAKLYTKTTGGVVIQLAPSLTGSGASGTWGINVTGSSASCTGNAATATNVAYSGLTGTAPTWNQNTTGSAASCTGNAATATILQTSRTINGTGFNGSAAIDTTEWFHSDRDFPNGTLITTNINYAVTNGDPFVLEIRGNSYGNIIPLDLLYQGYIYADTIINHGGISNGLSISGLVAINVGGNLCFWFPTQGYWNGYNVKAYAAYATRATNRVTSITGVVKPTSTKEVALTANIRQSLHTSNYNSYAPTLTGTGASGTWGINVTGSSASCTGNAATATNVAYSGLTGTAPTWNQNTTGSAASCTGNAATATNVAYSGLTGTAPTWNQNTTGSAASCTGNAATATNVAYSGLTGTAPTWNQNTTGSAASCTGNAATATTASNLTTATITGQLLFNNNVTFSGNPATGGCLKFNQNAAVFTPTAFDLGKFFFEGTTLKIVVTGGALKQFAFTDGSGASGSWGISVTGSAASCTGNAATASNSSQLNGLVRNQFWNNTGNNHGTYQTFNAIPDFGQWFMQGSGAGDSPQSGSQYYVSSVGLGNDYAHASFALMTAVARDHAVKYTYYRVREGGTWQSWVKAAAGYADSAGSAASCTGNAATATNVAYSGLTGTAPTWNQNTTGSSASCTGNAATATNVAYSGLTGTVPTWNQNTTGSAASCTGNAATATNVAYSGLTGTVPTWNQNTTGSAASCTGNAATATTASNLSGLTLSSGASAITPDNVTQNQLGYCNSVSLFGQTDGGLYSSAYSSAWIHQIYGDFRTGQVAVRGKNSGTWQAWRTLLDSSNYTSYAPSFTGTGASGTWGINVTGTSGSISGYNNPTTAATANTIVYRDSSGHLNSVYGFFNYLNMSHGVSGATGDTIFYSSGDDYIRKNNGTGFRASLNVPTRTGGDASGTWGINVSGSSASCTGNAATCTTATDPTKLPLTGGTVSGSLYLNGGYNEILMDGLTDYFKFRNAANQSVLIISKANTALNFSLGTPAANGFRFITSSGNAFTIANAGSCSAVLSFNAPIFYDSNNTAYYVDPDSTSNLLGLTVTNTITGSISGNAATVTNGVYLYTSNTLTGANYFRSDKGSGVYAGASNSYALQAYSTDSGSAAMTFHRGGYYAVNMGLDPDNVLRIGGWSAAANRWQLDMSGNNTVAGSLTANSTLTVNNGYSYVANNYGYGIVGLYNASVFQLVFAMGDAYKTTAGGGISNLYGIAWSHPNAGGIAANLNTHGALVTENGAFLAAISGSIRCRDDMRAPIFYDSNNTGYYVDPASTSNLNAANFAGAVGTGNLTVTGAITATGNITAYFSDDRLKTRLGPITDPIAKIKALSGFYFEPNQTAQSLGYERKTDVGVSAQEVQAILPEIIAPAPIDAAYMTVRYEKLIPLLIEAVKAQQVQIEELKAHIVILQQTSK